MTQPYECEVRFGIEDIEDFQARLGRLGAKIAFPYVFTDLRPIHFAHCVRSVAATLRSVAATEHQVKMPTEQAKIRHLEEIFLRPK